MSISLKPFGDPESETGFTKQTLCELIGHLEGLIDSEVERMEEIGANVHGKGPLALRLDLVERAVELLNIADEGDRIAMAKFLAKK